MAMATTTTLSDLIQESMGKALLAPRNNPLFFPGMPAADALRIWDATGGGEGSHDFNVYGSLTAYDTEESEPHNEVQSLDPTSTNVAPTERQVITWISNKAMRALGAPNAASQRAEDEAAEHVRAHMDKFDTVVFNAFTSLAEGASDTGNDIVVADIETALLVLQENNAPKPYWGFLSSQMWNDLATEADSALADAAQSNTIGAELWQNYEVRQFLGVTWFISDNVYTDGTDDYGGIISDRAIGVFLDLLPQVTLVDEETSAEAAERRAVQVSSVMSYGAGVIDSTMGVYLQFDT